MAEGMETYRGVVNPRECDTVEHLPSLTTSSALPALGGPFSSLSEKTKFSARRSQRTRGAFTRRSYRSCAPAPVFTCSVASSASTRARCDSAIRWSTRQAHGRCRGSWKLSRFQPRRHESCGAGSRQERSHGQDPRVPIRELSRQAEVHSLAATVSSRGSSTRAGGCHFPPMSIGFRQLASSFSPRSA